MRIRPLSIFFRAFFSHFGPEQPKIASTRPLHSLFRLHRSLTYSLMLGHRVVLNHCAPICLHGHCLWCFWCGSTRPSPLSTPDQRRGLSAQSMALIIFLDLPALSFSVLSFCYRLRMGRQRKVGAEKSGGKKWWRPERK